MRLCLLAIAAPIHRKVSSRVWRRLSFRVKRKGAAIASRLQSNALVRRVAELGSLGVVTCSQKWCAAAGGYFFFFAASISNPGSGGTKTRAGMVRPASRERVRSIAAEGASALNSCERIG
jgi:hypothetical protein